VGQDWDEKGGRRGFSPLESFGGGGLVEKGINDNEIYRPGRDGTWICIGCSKGEMAEGV